MKCTDDGVECRSAACAVECTRLAWDRQNAAREEAPDSSRPTLDAIEVAPAAEVAASIERNATALLIEVAPHALHGLGLAIASAFNRGIGHEAHAAEQLKTKLEDWVAANR